MDPIKRGVSSRDFGELNTKLNICTQKIFWKIAKMKNKTNYVNSLPILWQGLSKKVSVSFVKREWGREGGWGVCAATCSKSLPVAVFPISDVRPSRTIVQKRTWSYLWRRVEKKKRISLIHIAIKFVLLAAWKIFWVGVIVNMWPIAPDIGRPITVLTYL